MRTKQTAEIIADVLAGMAIITIIWWCYSATMVALDKTAEVETSTSHQQSKVRE